MPQIVAIGQEQGREPLAADQPDYAVRATIPPSLLLSKLAGDIPGV